MDQVNHCLTESRRVLVASHANPDGDAIGSLIATGLFLRKLEKTIAFYNESAIPAVYRFLPSVWEVQRSIDHLGDFDTAVVLDCGDWERIGTAAERIRRIPIVINIDHHVTNTKFGNHQLVDPEACATTEIIYRMIRALNVQMDSAIATAIYTGILTDTGSFRFSNTNQAAFAISTEMVRHGVDPFSIAQHVYGTYSLGRIKLLNMALDTIEVSKNGKLSLMAVTRSMMKETRTQPTDVDGLINYARGIENIKVAALIQEVKNGEGKQPQGRFFHVSLRSDGDVDVARIAADYGGGGHCSAAGFSIQCSLADIKNQLVQLAEKM